MTAAVKLTPWFSPYEKPTRKGVYERDHGVNLWFSKWDGEHWRFSRGTVDLAAREHMLSVLCAPWRGLAADPSKAAK